MMNDEFRALRIKKNYTQAALAEALGYSLGQVQKIEQGQRRVIARVANALRALPRCRRQCRPRCAD